MIGKSYVNCLLNQGPVLLRRHVRTKSDRLCDEVDLTDANSSFARVRYENGQETAVSTKDLAPCPTSDVQPISEDKTSSQSQNNASFQENGEPETTRTTKTSELQLPIELNSEEDLFATKFLL